MTSAKRDDSYVSDLMSQRSLSGIVSRYTDLTRYGGELRGKCPFHAEKTPSFYVNDAKGKYHCFGCSAGGDMINFIRDIENMSFNDACAHIEGHATSNIRQSDLSSFNNDKVEQARRIWNLARSIEGTPAEIYLSSRGIPLNTICPQDNLRYAELRFDGSAQLHPTMIAAVRDLEGVITGVQRTFLTSCGVKLCADAKRSLGVVRGGSIRLSAGAKTGDLHTLYVCEGLEDGLSLLRFYGDAPVWVTAGAGMMSSLKLPERCDTVRIASDNDEAGRRAAWQAGTKFHVQGRDVRTCILEAEYKDFNDYLLAVLADEEDEDDVVAETESDNAPSLEESL